MRSPGTCLTPPLVTPASASFWRASCSPQTVPSPSPSSARETVMQCIVEAVYSMGASGWPMLSASSLEAAMSTIKKTPPGRRALVGEVVPGEAAVGEGPGHHVRGVAAAAAHVQHIGSLPEPFYHAGDKRERDVDQRGVDDAGALPRHERLEAAELRVRHAAAVAEGVDDALLHVAEQGEVLSDGGQVVGPGRA